MGAVVGRAVRLCAWGTRARSLWGHSMCAVGTGTEVACPTTRAWVTCAPLGLETGTWVQVQHQLGATVTGMPLLRFSALAHVVQEVCPYPIQ